MQTFDQALFDLYESGLIAYEEALRNADSKNELRLRVKLESKRKDEIPGDDASHLRIVEDEREGHALYAPGTSPEVAADPTRASTPSRCFG